MIPALSLCLIHEAIEQAGRSGSIQLWRSRGNDLPELDCFPIQLIAWSEMCDTGQSNRRNPAAYSAIPKASLTHRRKERQLWLKWQNLDTKRLDRPKTVVLL